MKDICLPSRIHATRFFMGKVLKGDFSHPLVDAVRANPDGIPANSRHLPEPARIIEKHQPSTILRLTGACPQICSYCMCPTEDRHVLSGDEVDAAFAQMRRNNELLELVLSGGDPLFVKPEVLLFIADKVRELNSERRMPVSLSLSTRLPVVAPEMFDGTLMDAIRELNPSHMDIHILHPDEITAEFLSVCNVLNKSVPGLSMGTVHPLLSGINADAALLKELYSRLNAEARIRPRDLAIPVPEVTPKKLLVSLEEAMAIMRELVRMLPGKLVPNLTMFCYSRNWKGSDVDPFHTKADGTFGYDVEGGHFKGLLFRDGSGPQPAA